jgi:hypothetical protein
MPGIISIEKPHAICAMLYINDIIVGFERGIDLI